MKKIFFGRLIEKFEFIDIMNLLIWVLYGLYKVIKRYYLPFSF